MEYLYGTLHVAVDMDITEIHRVCLSQNGTHYAEMYYPDYTDEEIQKIQDLEQAQFDTMYELGKQAAQEDLQPTCNKLATDCISRQDVLNWLNDEWDGMVLSVFDGIRNFPSAQQEPQWIPCSERLPSEGENVLLCNTLFGNVAIGKLIRYNTSCCWEVDHWDCDIEDWQAWMPLPEPYKEKDNEKA